MDIKEIFEAQMNLKNYQIMLDPSDIKELDALAVKLTDETGKKITRSSLIRVSVKQLLIKARGLK